jgi:hypothetical protein
VPPTGELLAALEPLVERFGPVLSIVLPTSSGLEHKLPVPAMARAFPEAALWVSPRQWSFPLPLPLAWLGFPARRTRVLFEQGLPHTDELTWLPLGPLDLGLGTFMEVACFHRASGALLITDALVAISAEPPALFEADPTPLLFHARDSGDQPLRDDPERRRRGWRRLVLFASYLRPASVEMPPWRELLAPFWQTGLGQARLYFGLYPFRWQPGWEEESASLIRPGETVLQVAPVLERLVFPRQRHQLVAWLRQLAAIDGLGWLVPAHYEAPFACDSDDLNKLADDLERRAWAPSSGSWAFLAGLDQTLVGWGLVPGEPERPG